MITNRVAGLAAALSAAATLTASVAQAAQAAQTVQAAPGAAAANAPARATSGQSDGSRQAGIGGTAAHCSVSKRPAFRKLPFYAMPDVGGRPSDNVELTTTRKGLWAGSMFSGATGRGYLFTWRKGGTPRVLAHVRYIGQVFDMSFSVHAVGIAPGARVVANIEDPKRKHTRTADDAMRAFYFSRGHLHLLRHASSWTSWQATGVSDAGVIIGYATRGSYSRPRYQVIRWASPGAAYRVVDDTGSYYPSPVIDGAGDMGWSQASRYSVMRTASGVTHELHQWAPPVERPSNIGIPLWGASAHAIYGGGQYGPLKFEVSESTRTGPLLGRLADPVEGAGLTAVGRNGTLLETVDLRRSYVVTPDGARARLRALRPPDGLPQGAIDAHGRIAFTSRRDERIHFMTCR